MPTIRIDKTTFATADAILALLSREWGFGDETKSDPIEEVAVRGWNNGREQGYLLEAYTDSLNCVLQICFGAHRCSDFAPTIHWRLGERAMEHPEGNWQIESPKSVEAAAEWIRSCLSEFYEKPRREKKQADRIQKIEDQHQNFQDRTNGTPCRYGHADCAINTRRACLDEIISNIEAGE